jgi:hypothetical protein
LQIRRRKMLEMRIVKSAEDILRDELLGRRRNDLRVLLTKAVNGDVDPYTAARSLLRAVTEGL